MTRDELLAILKECAADDDAEMAHGRADDALIDYINDPEIAAVYESIEKWYA
jgi:hypothetical protein